MQERILKRLKITSHVSFRHLAIFCLDGSGSMQALSYGKISKADYVSSEIHDVFSRMKSSRFREAYSFAIVNYDHRAKVVMPPTLAKDIDDEDARQYNPTLGFGGAQFISEGLMKAQELAEQFLDQATQGGLFYSVTILVISDGGDMNRPKTVNLVKQLKERPGVQIAGCFVETQGTEPEELRSRSEYIKSICSQERLFSRVSNSETLRGLFLFS